MKVIERNFKKHPHTARFLQTFHTAVTSAGVDHRADDNAAEYELAAQEDLLNLVPENKIVDYRSPAQARTMASLVDQIVELDTETGRLAAAYTIGMTEHGLWTAGPDGKASVWITNMIKKVAELKAAARAPKPQQPEQIPAGWYAIETDEVRCYAVDYGKAGTRWEGFLFLNRISSDDRFPIRNAAEKARILATIAADIDGAATLAAHTLRKCRRCHRTLSDTKNPYFAEGLGPDCGSM